MLAKLLQDPVVGTLPHDERARLDVHRSVLERKPMIREVFVDFHRLFRDLERKYLEASGLAVEVGAGVAPMRSSYPDVLCTDIVHDPNLDCVVDAQRLPFADASVRVLYAQNSFHHLPDPARFYDFPYPSDLRLDAKGVDLTKRGVHRKDQDFAVIWASEFFCSGLSLVLYLSKR